MLTTYFIIMTFMCAFMAFIWTNVTWLNVAIKFTFICLAGWSIFNVFQHLGYIVKVVA